MRNPARPWSLAELTELPTLAAAGWDDLKIDEGGLRVWLSRQTVEGGALFENKVSVERLDRNGEWVRLAEYHAT